MNVSGLARAGARPSAIEWWRAASPDRAATSSARGRTAFVLVAAYSVVLIAAPQEFVRVLAPLRLAFLCAAAAFAAYLMDRWRGRARTEPWPIELRLVCALVGWAIATLPYSYWPSGSVGVLVNLYLKSIAVFVLLAGTVDSARRLRALVWVLTGCAFVIAVTALEHYEGGQLLAGASDRILGYGTSGMAGNPNDLALLLNILIPLMVALFAITKTGVARAALAVAIAASVLGVLATFSRAGFITLAVSAGLGVWHVARRGALGWIGVAALAAAAVAALAPARYTERLATVIDVDADRTGSAQDRWRDTVAAATFAVEHPAIGAGLGMDYLALNDVRGAEWLSVHNAYLNYAVDLGLVGLGLFLAMFGCALAGVARVAGHRARARDPLYAFATAIRIALCAFAVAACFHPIAYHAYFYYLAGLAVAVRQADALEPMEV